MRILHIVSSLNVGGAERFVIDLAIEQNQNQALKPSVLSMGEEREPLEEEILKVKMPLYHAVKIGALRKILSKYDVVHVHSSHSLLRILLASILLPIRVIYTRHNERVHTSFKWRIIYLLARVKLHKMIFVAEKARTNYLNVFPHFNHKAKTVLNGVLPMKTEKHGSHVVRLSHVGRFVPLKSQHVVIEALEQLPEPIKSQVNLSFYGTGPLLEKNQALAKAKIPTVEVNFKGFVTDRNEIYQNTDILIVTSETEGLSLAVLEALASGTPVIASNVGGNPELVRNGDNGLLYEYADYTALATCIMQLLEDKALYQTYSKESIKLYQENFSMAQCAQQYLLSYQ